MPTVTVRYFAQLREARGRDDERVDVTSGTTLSSLYQQLFPGALSALPVGYARNHELARGSDPVVDGDEVVFLPPVGGG